MWCALSTLLLVYGIPTPRCVVGLGLLVGWLVVFWVAGLLCWMVGSWVAAFGTPLAGWKVGWWLVGVWVAFVG